MRCHSLFLFVGACVLNAAFAVRVNAQGSGERAQAAMQRAVEAEDWPAAIDAALKLVELSPTDPAPAYNLACVYAQSGDKDQAIAWLKKAGERGFSFTSTLLRDEDLDSIRDHTGYRDAVEIVRRNNAAELEKFKEKYGDAKVLTFVPPGLDPSRPAPLIVALHGRGSDAANIAAAWRKTADESSAILIAPQAVMQRGPGFDWGVVEQGEWLVLHAIERTKAAHKIDEQRIVLTGFSQGGAMTYLIGLRQPEMFAGLIPMAGFYEHRITPIPGKASRMPRVFIMYGELDADVENNREAARRFETAGVPCKLKIYPGLGHAFPVNRDVELREALRFVLEP